MRVHAVKSVEEEASLLGDQPLAQVLVPAIGESADEVRDVVVLDCFGHFSLGHLGPAFCEIVVVALDVQPLLLGVVIDFLGHLLVEPFLV